MLLKVDKKNCKIACLPTKHLGVHMNSFKLTCPCVPDRIGIWKCWFFEERGKPDYPEKNLSEQRREPSTNSTHIWRRRRESNPGTLVGGERSHHCAVPCSPNGSRELAPQVDQNGNAYISFYIGAKGQKRTNLKTISENIAGQVFVACA